MKKILSIILTLGVSFFSFGQPWSPSGTCDFTDGVQWNNGGAKGCACTWYSVSGVDTILNCAFGDCGQNALYECVYDCNGHNGYVTDNIARQCDTTADPLCWFNGAGSAGELYCAGLDALPVELIRFWGESTELGNEIYWDIASEYNNDRFEIEHSEGGNNFTLLTTIKGHGTTSLPTSYRFIHTTPNLGFNYYKLKQIDYNGTIKEYPIISLLPIISDVSTFSNIFPNPSSGVVYFNYWGKTFNQPIKIELVDYMGVVIQVDEVVNFNNSQSIAIALIDYSKGVYQLRITQGDKVEVKKIILI